MRAKRKGFTVVEVVISLVIISIASAAATSVIISSFGIQNSSRSEFFAVNFCANSYMVFQAAIDASGDYAELCENFTEKMSELLEIDLSMPDPKTGSEEPTPKEGYFEAYLDSNWQQVNENGSYKCVFDIVPLGELMNFEVKVYKGDSPIGSKSISAAWGKVNDENG